eukprot:gnl/MRDRNA2_/MRDRNA2_21802_c0_seq1.p1 gnl/MRDRNA2_/MRDRNA2_21802_c0~~gnl/MRDRNA2_/MRDRNA2_21802_c0_seq1.p1  ORF type:complete len:462 (+),score=66.40 gnl/MRDRNA2_/MRDRNA2_21802_c0_seq1:172-1386(+)
MEHQYGPNGPAIWREANMANSRAKVTGEDPDKAMKDACKDALEKFTPQNGTQYVHTGFGKKCAEKRAALGKGDAPTGPFCAVCCASADLLCSGCHSAHYCSKACRKRHWKEGHREECHENPESLSLVLFPSAAPPRHFDISALRSDQFQKSFRTGEGRPVVIRGAVSASDWNLSKFKKLVGKDAPLQARFYRGTARTPETWTQIGYCDLQPVTAGEFVELVRKGRASSEDIYVNCDVRGTKAGEILARDLRHLGETLGLKDLKSLGPMVNIWWGAPGHTEPLHSDMNDGTLMQLCGRKRVVLFPASEWIHLYPFPMSSEMSAAWSRVNLEKLDACLYPQVRGALPRRMEFVLEEGDVLFIPACWAHEISGIDDGDDGADHILSVNRFWHTGNRAVKYLPEDMQK